MGKRLRFRLLAMFGGTAILAVSGLTAAPLALAGTAHTSHGHASAQVHSEKIHIRVMPADSQGNVSPRVACGGANGVIKWDSGVNPWIEAYGEAWDNCGSGTYVQAFSSYHDPALENYSIATAGPNSTVGFNTGQLPTLLNPGNIGLAACQHAPNWSCGSTKHP